eukprot:Sdes_comp14866_c0_seq1m3600
MLRNFGIRLSNQIYSKYESSFRKFSTTTQSNSSVPKDDQDVVIPAVEPIVRHNENLSTKRKRLLYQTRKRGILENDLIISTFFEKYQDKFCEDDLRVLDDLLDQNDWDLYYWATQKRPVPQKYTNTKVMNLLIEHAKNTERKILRQPPL